MKHKDQIRKLPGVDIVLEQKSIADLVQNHGHHLVASQIRAVIENCRSQILLGKEAPDLGHIVTEVHLKVQTIFQKSLRRVFNATGIILHTNLGRAPLGEQVLVDLADTVLGYSNLEFNLADGGRGQRGMHINSLVRNICGAEDAIVVNNNAAGIVLALNTLANQKEVIISRGELVEIGGSFRIPDIMAAAGAIMVEVGTTNKTHLTDYENAMTAETALILKVHKSNYSIQGFTKEVGLKDLVGLAHSRGLPLLYDLGSGLLNKTDRLTPKEEPDVRTSLAEGADIVAFSGDKLLGGPQAGILAGNKEWISLLNKAPMMRALRVGKLTIAALSSVLHCYLDEQSHIESIPVQEMLHRSLTDKKRCAEKLLDYIAVSGVPAKLVKTTGQCGGGTLPSFEIDSFGVVLVFDHTSQKQRSAAAARIHQKLLTLEVPVIGILRQGKILFDLLTISEADIEAIGSAVVKAAKLD